MSFFQSRELEFLSKNASIAVLADEDVRELDKYFAKIGNVRLDNIDKISNSVERGITEEIEKLLRGISSCEKVIEKHFAEFKRVWPVEAGDLDASVDSANEFFNKLERLEKDGLPEYEHRFLELLQNQSFQNLAALFTYLKDGRRKILERMDIVNDSLSQVPFNQSENQRTYLRIEVSDRQLAEVKEFMREIQQAQGLTVCAASPAVQSGFGSRGRRSRPIMLLSSIPKTTYGRTCRK